MESINYKPGIKKNLADITKDVTLARSGSDLLDKLFLDLNTKLINKSLDVAGDSSNVTAIHTRDAVDTVLTGNLKILALAESDRIISLHTNGLIEYKLPQLKILKRKKKKGKKALIVAAKEFNKGVSDITTFISPRSTLPTQSNTILSEILEETAVKLTDFIQEKGGDRINQDDVRNAIETLFPEELSKHAIANGTREMFTYEAGRKRSRKRKIDSVTESLEFKSGVSNLASSIFKEAFLPDEPTESVCELLEDAAAKISDFVRTKAGDCIEQKEVRDACINLLPSVMAKHAIAEGARMLILYETGRLEIKGKTRKTAKTMQTRKRR